MSINLNIDLKLNIFHKESILFNCTFNKKVKKLLYLFVKLLTV